MTDEFVTEQDNPEDIWSCQHHKDKQPPHTCPYAEDILNDVSLCTCCSDCEHQCAMDI